MGRFSPLLSSMETPSCLVFLPWRVHWLVLQESAFCIKCCGLGPGDFMWGGLWGEQELCCTTWNFLHGDTIAWRESHWYDFFNHAEVSEEISLSWNRKLHSNADTQPSGASSYQWILGWQGARALNCFTLALCKLCRSLFCPSKLIL